MGNPAITRFPYGVNASAEGSIFGDMPFIDPTKFHEYFNDFNNYTAGDWVVTETDSAATEALAAGDGGLLLITNTAADNDLVGMQKTPAAFSLTAGKRAYFACKFKVSNATQIDVAIGMQVVDTTPLDVTDGIYFLKADDAVTIAAICRKNATTGSTTNANIGSLADDTYTTWAWYYDGVATVFFAIDGVIVASLDASSTYLPDTVLTPSFAIQNGNGVVRTATVDYIGAWFER